MQRFNAKRHVVRQALAELEHIGIVTREPNRGAAVRDFSAQEVEEICELREILQRRAAQRIPLPADAGADRPAAGDPGAATTRRSRGAIRAPSTAPTRNFITRCSPPAAARISLPAIEHYAYLTRAMRLYPLVNRELLEQLRREHWAMIEALKSGGPQGAAWHWWSITSSRRSECISRCGAGWRQRCRSAPTADRRRDDGRELGCVAIGVWMQAARMRGRWPRVCRSASPHAGSA